MGPYQGGVAGHGQESEPRRIEGGEPQEPGPEVAKAAGADGGKRHGTFIEPTDRAKGSPQSWAFLRTD